MEIIDRPYHCKDCGASFQQRRRCSLLMGCSRCSKCSTLIGGCYATLQRYSRCQRSRCYGVATETLHATGIIERFICDVETTSPCRRLFLCPDLLKTSIARLGGDCVRQYPWNPLEIWLLFWQDDILRTNLRTETGRKGSNLVRQ